MFTSTYPLNPLGMCFHLKIVLKIIGFISHEDLLHENWKL